MPTTIFHSTMQFIYLYSLAFFGLTRYLINRLISWFQLSRLSGSLGSCKPDIGLVLPSFSVKSGRVARNRVAVASGGSIGANCLPYQAQFAFSLGVESHRSSSIRGKWQLISVRFADIGLLQVLKGSMFLEEVGCFLVSLLHRLFITKWERMIKYPT
jgi:hypothetical protein